LEAQIQWASARVFPGRVEQILNFKQKFGKTIDRGIDVMTKARSGTPDEQ
jgi:hypothetical protein